MTLRAAQAEPAGDIAEIWHRGWQHGHLGLVPQELVVARTEASFRMRASQRISDTTVATVGGAVVGFVMVVDDEVEQVYVAATHRGTGVAKVLIGETECQVKASGHGRRGRRSSPATKDRAGRRPLRSRLRPSAHPRLAPASGR